MADSLKVEQTALDTQPVLTSTPIEPKTSTTNQASAVTVEQITESTDSASGNKNSTLTNNKAAKNKEPFKRNFRSAPRAIKQTQLAATNQKVKKVQKEKAPKIKASHPPFFEMITQAINKLNERSGSSRQAILKFIVSNFKVEEKSGNQYVKISLKNAVKAGTLKQVKGVGASGSFKLSDALKIKKKSTSNDKAVTIKKAPAKKVTAAVAAKKIVSSATVKSKTLTKKVVKSKKNIKKTKTSAKPVSVASKKTIKSKTTTKKAAKLKTKQATATKKGKAAASTPLVKKNSRNARKSC